MGDTCRTMTSDPALTSDPAVTSGTEATPVHIVSLGCARNDVDSEELAGRLEADGFRLVADAGTAAAVLVNTCGFIEQAKKDSVDALLTAADQKSDGVAQAVVAVGCMAERYGQELAESMPEVDAVLGFDDYTDIADRLRRVMAGDRPSAHVPRDRRRLLPVSPVARRSAQVAAPGHGAPGVGGDHQDLPAGMAPSSGPRAPIRRRLGSSPSAPLKIASGCDRRCSFCAIPAFRGAYLSRTPEEIVAEAEWLADHGVRELFLVSENSSSYGKDLGDLRLMEQLLARLSDISGVEWIRVSYLQPAEIRPSLLDAMLLTPKVVPYFDLSFQHASPGLLRRMRRFGDPESFLSLIERIRTAAPSAGIRSNVIMGFPGESDDDVQMLTDFLVAARLDVVGVFGYSDEEGTEGVSLNGHVDPDEIEARRAHVADLVGYLCEDRAAQRIGERLQVLVEDTDDGVVGRAAHQAPEVEGNTQLVGGSAAVGELVWSTVTDSYGIDLLATAD